MNDHALDQLTAELRAVAKQVDPVPETVTAAARAAFGWRLVDAELAELTYDSWVDDRALVGVRGSGGPRQLTFEASGLTVEVEMGDGAAPRLVGQFVPARAGVVEVRHQGGVLTVAVDDLGRFAAHGIPSGSLSLRCTADALSPVETEWVAV